MMQVTNQTANLFHSSKEFRGGCCGNGATQEQRKPAQRLLAVTLEEYDFREAVWEALGLDVAMNHGIKDCCPGQGKK